MIRQISYPFPSCPGQCGRDIWPPCGVHRGDSPGNLWQLVTSTGRRAGGSSAGHQQRRAADRQESERKAAAVTGGPPGVGSHCRGVGGGGGGGGGFGLCFCWDGAGAALAQSDPYQPLRQLVSARQCCPHGETGRSYRALNRKSMNKKICQKASHK